MPIYKYGKQTTPLDFATFKKAMTDGYFADPKPHKSYVTFLYWIGCRRTEALMLTKESFKITDTDIIVKVPTLKKGLRKKPLRIPRHLPFTDIIVGQVERTPQGARVWAFSERTATRVVKRALGEKFYPHYLRFNRSTKFLDDPTTTIPEMKAWFGWKSTRTIDDYIGYSKRHVDRQANRLKPV